MRPRPEPPPDPERWHALENHALEPSAAASAAFAAAAALALPAAERPLLHACEERGALLCLAPLKHARWRYPPLARIASSRFGAFFFSGLPLIDARAPERAFDLLAGALRGHDISAVEFAAVPAEGPFLRALQSWLRRRGRKAVELARWKRAALDATRAPEAWWREDVSRRHRKEWNRLKRRLGERGELRFEALAMDEDVGPWLDDFLVLEKSGWKGRAGTAIACDAREEAFVRRMVGDFHASGRLRFWRLRLDERTIASLFGFLTADVLWLGKIARDEAFDAYSPGVLLVIEATRAILADETIRFADSCADPDHPMIDHLWRQRLELVDVLAPLPEGRPWRFALLTWLERIRRAGRNAAKRFWRRLRGRRR